MGPNSVYAAPMAPQATTEENTEGLSRWGGRYHPAIR